MMMLVVVVGRVDGWRAMEWLVDTHHIIWRNSWSSAAALAALDRCAGRCRCGAVGYGSLVGGTP